MLRSTDRLRYDLDTAAVTLNRQARSLDEERLRGVVAGMRSPDRSIQVAINRWMLAKGVGLIRQTG